MGKRWEAWLVVLVASAREVWGGMGEGGRETLLGVFRGDPSLRGVRAEDLPVWGLVQRATEMFYEDVRKGADDGFDGYELGRVMPEADELGDFLAQVARIVGFKGKLHVYEHGYSVETTEKAQEPPSVWPLESGEDSRGEGEARQVDANPQTLVPKPPTQEEVDAHLQRFLHDDVRFGPGSPLSPKVLGPSLEFQCVNVETGEVYREATPAEEGSNGGARDTPTGRFLKAPESDARLRVPAPPDPDAEDAGIDIGEIAAMTQRVGAVVDRNAEAERARREETQRRASGQALEAAREIIRLAVQTLPKADLDPEARSQFLYTLTQLSAVAMFSERGLQDKVRAELFDPGRVLVFGINNYLTPDERDEFYQLWNNLYSLSPEHAREVVEEAEAVQMEWVQGFEGEARGAARRRQAFVAWVDHILGCPSTPEEASSALASSALRVLERGRRYLVRREVDVDSFEGRAMLWAVSQVRHMVLDVEEGPAGEDTTTTTTTTTTTEPWSLEERRVLRDLISVIHTSSDGLLPPLSPYGEVHYGRRGRSWYMAPVEKIKEEYAEDERAYTLARIAHALIGAPLEVLRGCLNVLKPVTKAPTEPRSELEHSN